MAENPIPIDKEKDKEYSPLPNPTTRVSERPIQPHVLLRSRLFGTRIENVPEFVYRKLFE